MKFNLILVRYCAMPYLILLNKKVRQKRKIGFIIYLVVSFTSFIVGVIIIECGRRFIDEET